MPPVKSNPSKGSSRELKTTVKKKKNFFFKTSANIKLTEKPSPEDNFKIKPSKNFARLPTKPDEASSNWKSLSTLIKPVQSKGRLLYLERKKKKEAVKKVEESAFVISEKTNNDPEIWFDGVDPILLDTPNSKLDKIQFGSNGSKE